LCCHLLKSHNDLLCMFARPGPVSTSASFLWGGQPITVDCRSHCQSGGILWFDDQGETQRCDWLDNSRFCTCPVLKSEFVGNNGVVYSRQYHGADFPRALNHGISLSIIPYY